MSLTADRPTRVSADPVSDSGRISDAAIALGLGAAASLLIGGPWLAGGYLFGTDWPGPRHFAILGSVSSTTPLEAVLWLLASAIGAQAVGKALFLGSLFVAASASFLAVPVPSRLARTAAAVAYVFNPFVYDRLIYGQVYLLAAYAVLPITAALAFRLVGAPKSAIALCLGFSLAVCAVFTIHVFLLAAILVAIVFAASLRTVGASPRSRALFFGLAGLSTIVLTSYWTVPLIAGDSRISTVLDSISASDLVAFASVPDSRFGLLPNLLGLYGFWGEATGRFASMKQYAPAWPAVLTGLVALSAMGCLWGISRGGQLRAWAVALVAAGVASIGVEAFFSRPSTLPAAQWLADHFVLLRGMRDAGKWSVVVALAESQLLALGVAGLSDWVGRRVIPGRSRDWATAGLAVLALAGPIYYGNGLVGGLHGTMKPSDYPAGWYAADRILSADPNPGKAVFLPWHEYMGMSFVRNQNPVVVSPAPSFFSVPIVVSSDPEVTGITAPSNSDQQVVTMLVRVGAEAAWSSALRAHGLKYVILAREVDWKQYSFLDFQPGLTKIGDFGSVIVYEVMPAI